MPPPSKPTHSGGNQTPLDSDTIKAIVEQGTKKIELEAKQIELAGKELDANTEIAKLALDKQAEAMKNAHPEHRKTVITYAVIVVVGLLIILAFVGMCVFNGKEEFIIKSLKGAKDVLIGLISFFIGRKSISSKKDKKSDSSIQEPEIID